METKTKIVTYTLDLETAEQQEVVLPRAPGSAWSIDWDQDTQLRFDQAFSQLDAAIEKVIDAYELPWADIYSNLLHMSLCVRLEQNRTMKWEVRFNHDGKVECRDYFNAPTSATPPLWKADDWENGFAKFIDFLQDDARNNLRIHAQQLENLKAIGFRTEEPSSIPPKP